MLHCGLAYNYGFAKTTNYYMTILKYGSEVHAMTYDDRRRPFLTPDATDIITSEVTFLTVAMSIFVHLCLSVLQSCNRL